jgi:uncharacterized protein YndB with AHSA1/START domain
VTQSAAAPAGARSRPFVMTRVFDAPRELVFDAFTDPERMKHSWGPKGFEVIASKMDLRPGGSYHYGLRAPDGGTMWGKLVYREIVRPERMVLVNSFSDETGGLTRHPMSADWPLEMLSTFRFEDENGKTRFTVTWTPLNATSAEQVAFDAAHGSMEQGWGGTLDSLAAYLAKR